MNERLNAFVNSLIYWLGELGNVACTVVKSGENSAELRLLMDGVELYVGDNAEPGLLVEWLGVFQLPPGEDAELVRANDFVVEAKGRRVAGWVIGEE